MTNSIYSNTLKVWWTQGKKRGKLTHVYVLRFAFLDLTWDYPGNSFEFVPKIPDSIYFSLARAEKAAQSKWETEYDKILAKLPAEDSEREDLPPHVEMEAQRER